MKALTWHLVHIQGFSGAAKASFAWDDGDLNLILFVAGREDCAPVCGALRGERGYKSRGWGPGTA